MPATVTQILEGTELATGDRREATLAYYVAGASTEAEALTAVGTASPDVYLGLARQSRRARPLSTDSYVVTARYSDDVSNDSTDDPSGTVTPPTESTYEFSTGGGSETMFVSLQTMQGLAGSGVQNPTVPDYDGGINVTDDGPQGVERTVPVFNFSETHYKTSAQVTQAYIGSLFALTGTVNTAAFKGFAAGEVLFLGARGSKRGPTGDWELTYSFAASPNIANGTIGNFTGVNKDGWDYLWFQFEDVEDTAAKQLVRRPAYLFVERVYRRADFSLLAI
jgi:hypothetical protein